MWEKARQILTGSFPLLFDVDQVGSCRCVFSNDVKVLRDEDGNQLPMSDANHMGVVLVPGRYSATQLSACIADALKDDDGYYF
jgi:hypothetical protein